MNLRSIKIKIKGFINECARVLRVTKKPDKAEFTSIVKASGLGILIIGLLGFLIQMVKVLFLS